MRVGIIGTGRHGSRYANHVVRDVEGLELAAICRRDRAAGEAQAGEYGCVWHGSWEALVADPAVEAVIAVTVPSLNPAIARACCRWRKPLLVEKPLAVNGASAEALVRRCREAAVPLTVGQTLRFNQVIQCLRREFGRLGRLHAIQADQRIEPSTLAWHEDPNQAGAGVSIHTAVHVFDALRYLTGREVVRVAAAAAGRYNRVLEDHVVVALEMEGGVLGTVDCSKVSQSRSGRLQFVGARGQLQGEQVHNEVVWIQGMVVEPIDPGPPVPTIRLLLERWRDYLRGAGENPVPGEEGLAAVRVCEACLRAVETGRWEPVAA